MIQPRLKKSRGEIATTLTIASLIVMIAGVVVGRNEAVRQSVQKYISSAQTPTTAPTPPPSSQCPKSNCRVRLVKNTLNVYRDQNNAKLIHIEGNFCFDGEATSGTHQGRLWLSKDSGGKDVVGPVRQFTFYPGNTWPGPCDRSGELLKNRTMNTQSASNSFSYVVSIDDFPVGTNSCPLIYFNYVSTGGGGQTYDERGFVALKPQEYNACGPTPTTRPSNTPTPNATNTPTPSGACSLNLTAYVKEKMSDGTLREMTEIDKEDVKWYAINDQQIARHGTNYSPGNAADNWYGFTDGKIIANIPNVTWPIKAASDDSVGRPYVYQKGSKAKVTLFFDKDQYEIESAEVGPGTVEDTSKKDTIANLPLDCNQNYSYGWIMKKKVANSCPLKTTENAEKCKPKNVQAQLQAGSSHKVDVSWDRMTDSACEFDVYHLDIVDPADGSKIICHRSNVPKNEDEGNSRISVGCSVRTDRTGVNKEVDNFTPGGTYTANIYLGKDTPPGCNSNPGSGDFTRPGGSDNSKRSHQFDLWDLNQPEKQCFISADTTGDTHQAGATHCSQSANVSDNDVKSLTVEYRNTTSGTISLQWQTNSCNGKLLSDLTNKECKQFVSDNSGQPIHVGVGQMARCKWDNPAGRDRPTPENCDIVASTSGGGTGGSGGSGGSGGTNPTTPPSGGATSTTAPRSTTAPTNPTAARDCNTTDHACRQVSDFGIRTNGIVCRRPSDGTILTCCQAGQTRDDANKACIGTPGSTTPTQTGLTQPQVIYKVINKVPSWLANYAISDLSAEICTGDGLNCDRNFDNLIRTPIKNGESATLGLDQKPGTDADVRPYVLSHAAGGEPFINGKTYKIGCALKSGLIFIHCKNKKDFTSGSSTGVVTITLEYEIPIKPKESILGTNFNLVNQSQEKATTLTIKICESGTNHCEDFTEDVNVLPGQQAKVNKTYSQLLGTKLDTSKRYTVGCQVTYSSGSSASCASPTTAQIDNPLYYDLTLRSSKVDSEVKTEQQLADVNSDKANNTLDCAKMLTNYNTAGADANKDGTTNSLDVSLCHKWLLKSR